jgi:ribonuclease-3
LRSVLGVDFADPALLEQSLTHKSAGRQNNERLEFLGDAVLGLVIADALFHRHGSLAEDGLSLLRAALVNRDALAAIARRLELGRVVRLGPGELRSGGHERSSILADTLEALIGAVFIDAGFDVARDLILRLFNQELINAVVTKDPKTRLQEWLQARKSVLPEYEVVRVTGEQHARNFEVRCCLSGRSETALGTGSSRRAAEQQAAAAVLVQLGAHSSAQLDAQSDSRSGTDSENQR